jgi:hypothetical protein
MPTQRKVSKRKDANYQNLKAAFPELQRGTKKKAYTLQDEAKHFGMSHDTYYRRRYVWRHGTPEIKEKLDNKEISVNKAYLLTRPEAKPKSRLDRGSYKVIQKADKARLTIETNAQNLPTILRALERLGIRLREPENG